MMETTRFGFIASLAYTLIPMVTKEEARRILSWVFGSGEPSEGSLAALNQIEYLFAGTDNGRLFMFPLLPPSMRPFMNERGDRKAQETMSVPWNAGPRRLLHRHGAGGPVVSVGTLGTLVASAGSDACVHLSVYHPLPQHIVSIPHPSPLRSLLMWEGGLFVAREIETHRRSLIAAAESSIVYMFTGDESGMVRAWRVNVDNQKYFLVTVFVIASLERCVGFASPLRYLAREDAKGTRAPTQKIKAVHCLAIDDDQRLLGGVDGGVVVWSLAALPWKQREEDHILCWEDEKLRMNLRASPQLRFRVARLLNMSVWVKGAALLEESLGREKEEEKEEGGRSDGKKVHVAVAQRSRWKPKYGARVANGFDLGVVCNMVGPPPSLSSSSNGKGDDDDDEGEEKCAISLLRATSLALHFPSLKNTVHFPLWAVEPVFTPLRVVSTPGSVCFALLVLKHGVRIVTSGSDGKVTVWLWDEATSAYVMALVSDGGQGHCGPGRHVCLLRSPDIFVSCGYEDGVVKEWHVYDEPELLMRCERRFAVSPANFCASPSSSRPLSAGEVKAGGVSCAVSFPVFHVLFLVGLSDSTIQVFSLLELQGCAPPEDYIYNGYKTVRVTGPVIADRLCEGQTQLNGEGAVF